MNYAKGILSALAASFIALVLGCWPIFRELWTQKQTGLGAVAGGLSELLLSPLPWLLLAVFSLAFFRASQMESKPLRISLFWIPALTLSTVVMGLFALYALLFGFLLFKHY
jgi:hypothetical protein